MLDYNDLDLFDALETISLMDDYEFEKIRLEFENNGYILKRNKNESGDTNIIVEKKVVFVQGLRVKSGSILFYILSHKKNNSKR